jgi:tetratricopeptide (TPR) repeat protein
MIRAIIIISVLLLSINLQAQSGHTLLRDGDKNYVKEDFGEAEIAYHKALDKSRNHKSAFNLGNALFKQEKYEEAAGYFDQAVDLMPTNEGRSSAYHNLGNAHIHNGKLEEAITAYKNGLKLNPSDSDLRENLMIAKLMKKQAEEQQQEQEQQDRKEKAKKAKTKNSKIKSSKKANKKILTSSSKKSKTRLLSSRSSKILCNSSKPRKQNSILLS